MRVVVLGGKQSGKTSMISNIFGLEKALSSGTVMKREGMLNGKSVLIVDTPGWWRNFKLIDTAEVIKRKLQQSLSQCPPGPHAFILTVRVDLIFDEDNRKAIEEHMGLFGEDIWGHTIVVFTKADSLRDRSIEQHIETVGEALKWVLKKCGNRYCVYDSENSEGSQVKELLDKIENVTENNRSMYFKPDEKYLKEVEEEARLVKEKANSRFKRMMEKREKLKEEGKLFLKINSLIFNPFNPYSNSQPHSPMFFCQCYCHVYFNNIMLYRCRINEIAITPNKTHIFNNI